MTRPFLATGMIVLCGGFWGSVGLDAQETKIVQALSLSVWSQESIVDQNSPVSLQNGQGAVFQPGSAVDYTLRFLTKESSAQISAEGLMNSQSEYDGRLLQAWVKASLAEGWSLNFGKKIVKWSDGGFWNPSDIVNNRPVYGAKGGTEGRLLTEVNGVLPVGEDNNLDLSGVVPLDPSQSHLDQTPVFLAVGTVLYPFEIRLKGGFQSAEVPQAGLAVKLSLFNVEWYADGLYSRKSDLTAVSRADDNYYKGCAGFTGSLPVEKPLADSLAFAAEYAVRTDGLTKSEGGSFFSSVQRVQADPGFAFYEEYRQYAFSRLTLNNIFDANLAWAETWYLNLEDPSGSLESKLEWSPRNVFTVGFLYTFRHGAGGSEVSGLGARHVFELLLSKSF